MTFETQAVTARLDRLEKQNKTLKRWGAGLGLGLALMGLTSARLVCDQLSGERLVIRDTSGRTRILADAYTSESPSLVFSGKDGRAMAKLGIDERSGEFMINVLDSKGGVKASWRLGKEAPTTQQPPQEEKKLDGPVGMR